MNIAACEDLATKAELQELRDEINALLGKPYEGTSTINVLQAKSLAGTQLNASLVSEIEIVEDESTGEVKLTTMSTSPGGSLWEDGIELIGATIGAIVDISQKMMTNDEIADQMLEAGKKVEENIFSGVEKVTKFFDITNKIGRLEQDLADYKQITSDLAIQLYEANGNLEVAETNIDNLVELTKEQKKQQALIIAAIAQYNLELEDAKDQIEKNKKELLAYKKDVENFKLELAYQFAFAKRSIQELKKRNERLRERLDGQIRNFDKLYEFTEQLGINLAETQGRVTELEDRFTKLAAIQSIQYAELQELKIELGNETEARQASTVKMLKRIRILEGRSASSGGGSLANIEANARTQGRTVNVITKILGNPRTVTDPDTGKRVTVRTDFTNSDVTNGSNEFTQIMNGLASLASTKNIGDQVTPAQLSTALTDFGTGLKGDISKDVETKVAGVIGATVSPQLTNLSNLVAPAAIASATATGVCNQTGAGGCLANNIRNPLQRGIDAVNQNLEALLGAQNFALNTQILTTVTATQEFLGKAWNSTAIDKTLNAANTVLAFHNAAMLSRNLGESVGDTISLGLNALPIQAFDESPIDISQWVGDRATSIGNALVGAENLETLGNGINSFNRILVAGQGMISAVGGVKNALQEGQEIIVNRVGVLGNTFLEQGIFEEDSYPWMNIETNFRSPFSGFTQKIANLDEFVGEINQLVQSGIEVQENVGEFVEGAKELSEGAQALLAAAETFIESKEAEEEVAEIESESPDIEPSDLVQLEADEVD